MCNLIDRVRYQAPIYVISSPGAGLLVHYSGSHAAVFPTWLHKNQHCGLCGNFDGETDREWVSPQGCVLKDPKQLIASYTMGQTCYSSQEKNACQEGKFVLLHLYKQKVDTFKFQDKIR